MTFSFMELQGLTERITFIETSAGLGRNGSVIPTEYGSTLNTDSLLPDYDTDIAESCASPSLTVNPGTFPSNSRSNLNFSSYRNSHLVQRYTNGIY